MIIRVFFIDATEFKELIEFAKIFNQTAQSINKLIE